MPKLNATITTEAFSLPPAEAIEYLEGKNFSITWNTAEQIKINNARMFTIAKTTKIDVLQTVRDELQKSLSDGIPFKQFQKDITKKLQASGWIGKSSPEAGILAPYRLKNIYSSNIQSALNAGKWNRFKDNQTDRPYLRYSAVLDQSTRESHAALDGLVLHIDDPRWDSIMPSNGYQCRCTTSALTIKQAGLQRKAPTVAQKEFKPDKGWSGNSGKEGWKPTKNRWDSDLYNLGKF